MSDIEIARKAKMQPISQILEKVNVPDTPEAFSPMGRHIAKINLEYIDTLHDKKDGKWNFKYPSQNQEIILGDFNVYGKGKSLIIISYGNGLYYSLQAKKIIE